MAENSDSQPPPLAKHDASVLDLAFAMDCTGSMGSYIATAQKNIRAIVEDIVSSEKSDVKLALVEYRDHPPQDTSFVTRVHDFTGSVGQMKKWLDECSANGGGDSPEAVADALHQVLKLSWRPEATKICVLISDAPPHGLSGSGDGFPNGCPDGLDPMVTVREMAEKGITLYSVGCEPAIIAYKDFFTALAHITGGQYVPLRGARALTQVIAGGAQEEISLERFMEEVNREVLAEAADESNMGGIDEELVSRRVFDGMKKKGIRVKQLQKNSEALSGASESAKRYADMTNMSDVKATYAPNVEMCDSGGLLFGGGMAFGAAPPRARGRAMGAPPPPAPSSLAEDSYDVVESEINFEQAQRMVQKSMARNFVSKKK